jgi:DNA-binding XRE family transcriptional regulator
MATLEDDLDTYMGERSRSEPDLPGLVEAFSDNRALLDALTRRRAELHLSQRAVAARMGASQAAVGKIEAGDVDPRLSTVQRLAVSLGMAVKWELVEADDTTAHTQTSSLNRSA